MLHQEHQLLSESMGKHVSLTDEELSIVIQAARIRQYKKGQFLIHEGAAVRKTHFIRKGAAIAYFVDNRGYEHLIQFAVEGWWISDIQSFSTGRNALLHVQALEDTELYEFSFEDMERLYRQVPAVESYFLIITRNAFAAFQERVLYNLSLSAEERYENFVAKYPKLELRFPQRWIASYLGISAEFLSKIKKRRIARS